MNYRKMTRLYRRQTDLGLFHGRRRGETEGQTEMSATEILNGCKEELQREDRREWHRLHKKLSHPASCLVFHPGGTIWAYAGNDPQIPWLYSGAHRGVVLLPPAFGRGGPGRNRACRLLGVWASDRPFVLWVAPVFPVYREIPPTTWRTSGAQPVNTWPLPGQWYF